VQGPVTRKVRALVAVAALLVASGATAASANAASTTPKSGGTLTVLGTEAEWPTLDPAGNGAQPAADVTEFGAIYGQLFEAGPNNTVVPGEAAGYRTSDGGLQVDIMLRKGMTFQDGTAFNAAAVVESIKRDLEPAAGCVCTTLFKPVTSITAPSALDVRFKLSTPDAALIPSFVDNAPNYTVSPTALAKDGAAKFGQDPVGAGPFEVVSNAANSKLVLKRFGHYYLPGRPYLSGLVIESTGSDQTNVEALQTGQAQMTGVTTISLYKQAAKMSGLKVQENVPSTIGFLRLNSLKAPFNNPTARAAVAYATDAPAIVKGLYDNLYVPVEGWTAPGMAYYQKSVPGYKAYNPTKAKQLVQKLGGLSVTIQTTSNAPTMVAETEAIAAQWRAAGINTTIQVNPLTTTIKNTVSGNWETFDALWGCVVQAATCLPQNLASYGIFTGAHDKTLDGLIAKGQSGTDTNRAAIYHAINTRLDTQTEIIPLYAAGLLTVTTDNVHGLVKYPTSAGYEDFDSIWLS
jgi:peptide/nickel transport system substrate-binding protein